MRGMSPLYLLSYVPCPLCGVNVDADDCLDITSFNDPEPRYLIRRCPTPGCGTTCRTCRREPGDVHGPHCWVHMRDKLDRPHIVDRSDCR